jgi:hypothetical protein
MFVVVKYKWRKEVIACDAKHELHACFKGRVVGDGSCATFLVYLVASPLNLAPPPTPDFFWSDRQQ